MEDERRALLERVARGELSPAEAAALLEDMEESKAEAEADPRDWAAGWSEPVDWPAPPAAPTGEGAARIRVNRTMGVADIIGDPTVREAVAEGPHIARRDGDTLVIEGSFDGSGEGAEMPGFAFNWSGRGPRPRIPRHVRRHAGFRWGDVSPLRVRVNPNLPLEVGAQAGKLRITGVHGPIRASVQAGSTDISDFRSTLELDVQAGSVTARGRLEGGASRIRCNAGSVRIHLERGSSVRVTARSMLGKVVLGSGDPRGPWVVGGGDGTLDIDTTMGSVAVSAD